MRGMGFLRIGLFATLAGAASTAYCWTSSLNLIPVAEVLKHREISIGYGITGDPQSESHDASLQIGLFDRIEIGTDQNLRGQGTWNLKVKIVEAADTAIAVGFTDHSGRTTNWFGVASQSVGKLTLHGGWWRTDDRSSLIVGAEYEIGEISLMADHISGSEGSTWLGLSAPIAHVPGLEFGTALGVPNRRSGLLHTFYVTYTFRF